MTIEHTVYLNNKQFHFLPWAYNSVCSPRSFIQLLRQVKPIRKSRRTVLGFCRNVTRCQRCLWNVWKIRKRESGVGNRKQNWSSSIWRNRQREGLCWKITRTLWNSCLWLQSRSILSSFGVVLMSCKVNFHVVRSALFCRTLCNNRSTCNTYRTLKLHLSQFVFKKPSHFVITDHHTL